MPCALTPNAGYPDYLKSILKEIELGNDKRLKDCACKLKTPKTDEGCVILDEDGKLGLFPFCVQSYPNIQSVPPVSDLDFCDPDNDDYEACGMPFEEAFMKVTLAQAMKIFWKLKSITVTVNMEQLGNTYSCSGPFGRFTRTPTSRRDPRSPAEYKITRKVEKQKNLVCADKFFDKMNSFTEQSDTTIFTCTFSERSSQACYSNESISIKYAIYFRNPCPGGSGGWTEEECVTISNGVSPVVRIGEGSDPGEFYIRKPVISYYKGLESCGTWLTSSKVSVRPNPPTPDQFCPYPNEDRKFSINIENADTSASYYTHKSFSAANCQSLVPFQSIRVQFEFF